MKFRPRTARQRLGDAAEEAVADYLVARGLEVLDTNVRVGRLEIDVVARDGAAIAVVEVRTRGLGSWLRAFDSIDARKRGLLRRAGARLWRDRYARVRGIDRLRFDVASVTFGPKGDVVVEYVTAAFC